MRRQDHRTGVVVFFIAITAHHISQEMYCMTLENNGKTECMSMNGMHLRQKMFLAIYE
jgi:hypothetical protein